MEDDTLLNISISIAIIGIASLLFLSYSDRIPYKDFNSITSKDLDTSIKSNGTIIKIYNYNSSTVLKVKQECLMDVVIFDKVNFEVGEEVIFYGKVQEYKGNKQLIADRIIRK